MLRAGESGPQRFGARGSAGYAGAGRQAGRDHRGRARPRRGPPRRGHGPVRDPLRRAGERLVELGIASEDRATSTPAFARRWIRGTRGALPHRDPRDLRANRRAGRSAAESGSIPLVLGGDHSVAIGTIGGLASLHGPGGVLWFDAHADFNTPETTPSGAVHGMPLAAVLGRAGVGFESNSWPLPPWTPNGWR